MSDHWTNMTVRSEYTFNTDVSTIFMNQPMHDRKPHTGTLTNIFRTIKRIKHSIHVCSIYTASCIFYRKLYKISGNVGNVCMA